MSVKYHEGKCGPLLAGSPPPEEMVVYGELDDIDTVEKTDWTKLMVHPAGWASLATTTFVGFIWACCLPDVALIFCYLLLTAMFVGVTVTAKRFYGRL